MARYIDADALKFDGLNLVNGCTVLDMALAVIKAVQEAPTADVAEVRHGQWADLDKTLMCSECGIVRAKDTTGVYRYCPGCGANMDGEG